MKLRALVAALVAGVCCCCYCSAPVRAAAGSYSSSAFALEWTHPESGVIEFTMTAQTSGYTSFGLDKYSRAHAQTDTYYGYVDDNSGAVTVQDQYMTGFSAGEKDSTVGGSDDIIASSVKGTQSGGKTTITFRRKLATGDSKDLDLSGSTKYYIHWANGPSDNYRMHNKAKSSSQTYDFSAPAAPAPASCSVPKLAHASLDSSGPVADGGSLTLTCASGYELDGGATTAKYTCSDGTWSPKPLDCVQSASPAPSECSVPTMAHAWLDSSGSVRSGGTLTLTCVSGYSLAGGATTAKYACASGTWSPTPLDCAKDAGPGQPPSDTTDPVATCVVPTFKNADIDRSGSVAAGTTIVVTCVPGSTRKDGAANAKLVCQNDGTWQPQPADCNENSDLSNIPLSSESSGNSIYLLALIFMVAALVVASVASWWYMRSPPKEPAAKRPERSSEVDCRRNSRGADSRASYYPPHRSGRREIEMEARA